MLCYLKDFVLKTRVVTEQETLIIENRFVEVKKKKVL